MALFPCDIGRHPYRGPQRTMYPAIVQGGDSWRRKLRLCEPHFDALLEQLQERAHDAQMDSTDVKLPVCYGCNDDVVMSTAQMFVTVYNLKEDRVDFWAPLHELCAATQRELWLLDATIAS